VVGSWFWWLHCRPTNNTTSTATTNQHRCTETRTSVSYSHGPRLESQYEVPPSWVFSPLPHSPANLRYSMSAEAMAAHTFFQNLLSLSGYELRILHSHSHVSISTTRTFPPRPGIWSHPVQQRLARSIKITWQSRINCLLALYFGNNSLIKYHRTLDAT